MVSLCVFLLGGLSLLPGIIHCKTYNLQVNKMKTAIRRKVLKEYDKVIGPVKYGPRTQLEVKFRLSVTNLVEVNTREQILKVDGWIYQTWTDEFLSWKPKNYKGVLYTVFSRDEVWTSDIALLNNADRSEKLAGGPTKFITNVNAYKSGRMTWLSPATFTSTCQQNVKKWPMDTQVCTLVFGSCTYPDKNLVIVPINQTFEKGSISNGEWAIDDIEVFKGTTEHHKCCGKRFSTAVYTLTLTRKPDYFLFYLAPPVVILAVLAIMSFFIPTESGERIGFITTILLALMVFLLMIPEYLPKTSDQLPILGILLIFAMVMISTILVATIFILMCYHSEGRPAMMIQKMFYPLKTRSKKKLNEKKPAMEQVNMATELRENEDEPKGTFNEEEMATQDDEDEITWQQISWKLNWIFFLVICAITLGVLLFIFIN